MKLNPANKAALISTGIRVGLPIIGIGIGVLAIKNMLKRNPDGTSSKVAPSLKDTVIDRQNLTINVSDASLFANTLYGAMQNFGTDEQVIYSTIDKLQTKDDMLLVIKAFGMKKYLWGARDPWFGQETNLIGWLRAELKKKEIAVIKPKFDEWGIPL
jgi:hypothetical protein